MRTLDPYLQLFVDKTITEPRYLVSLTLNEPMNLSSRGGVSVLDEWWEPSELQIENVGLDTASIRIWNQDYEFTAGAVSGAYIRSPVQIYACYPVGVLDPYIVDVDGNPSDYWPVNYVQSPTSTTPLLMFDGFIIGTPEIGEWLTIECQRSLPKRYPLQKIRPPIANYLPATGMLVPWKGEVYRIES